MAPELANIGRESVKLISFHVEANAAISDGKPLHEKLQAQLVLLHYHDILVIAS